MQIVHFVNDEQLDVLFKIFAKPVNMGDWIDWVAPGWWYAMCATATTTARR